MANTKVKKDTVEAVDKSSKSHPLIKGPRITEKSAVNAERGTYTFNVDNDATKNEIKKAIKQLYGVTPVRIAMTKISKKRVVRRGIVGVKQGGKKAVVYLKKGDKITFA